MSTDGEDCDDEDGDGDGSSHFSSQRSGCDTDSNRDINSPRPHDLSMPYNSSQHSPLSPLMMEEEDDRLDTSAAFAAFQPSSSSGTAVPLLSSSSLRGSSSSMEREHREMGTPSKPVPNFSFGKGSPSVAAT